MLYTVAFSTFQQRYDDDDDGVAAKQKVKKQFDDMFSRFDTITECVGRTANAHK